VKNQLIAIGRTGLYRVYLNISLKEARRRYKEKYDGEYTLFPLDWEDVDIDIIDFNDEFEAYAVWGVSGSE
jgi:hypothetical protein